MANPASDPRLFPEAVPGGSLIGSVNSRIFATFTYKSAHKANTSVRSAAPTYTSFNSDASPHLESLFDEDITKTIQNLSRSKIEGLVTQAWIRNIPKQSDEKLRDLIASAVKKGILTQDDVHSTVANSFICLPTEVTSPESVLTEIQLRIVSFLSLRQRIVFLTAVNSHLIRLAHYPQLWAELDLNMSFQRTLSPLSNFLTKYTPARSIEGLYFPSTTRKHEFLKLLVTLKRLRSHLAKIHLSGKEVTRTGLTAIESLLGPWTQTIILECPSSKVDIAHITPLIAASSRLKTFALQTNTKFPGEEYSAFMKALVRAGETSRLHHRHPEINARLRTLQLSTLTPQTIKFSVLAELGRFFPLLEMLRIENWKFEVNGEEKIAPIMTLRGLALVGIDIIETKKSDHPYANILSKYLCELTQLEILMLGARDTDLLGWKLFVRKPEMGLLFKRLQLSRLKFLWLRGWAVDCMDLLSLKASFLKWLVLEECKGMNGGWVKAIRGYWTDIVVVESDIRLKDGIDLYTWKRRARSGIESA